MFICPICNLQTKQLNGLMSNHYKKHCNDLYTVDKYKIDVLNYNGRTQKICPICSKPTFIPKGEKDYSQYHKECFIKKLKSQTAEENSNYRKGKENKICRTCGKLIIKHPSLFSTEQSFCSVRCSTIYTYCKNNDITPAEYFEDIEFKKISRSFAASLEKVSLRSLRQSALLKANFKCKVCQNKASEIHHLNSYKFFNLQRFDENNLVCVCKNCHILFHKKYGYGRNNPNTKEQFEDFIIFSI
jgi:hypothetical protein